MDPRERRARYERVDVSFCGRRGFNVLKNRVKVRRHYEGVTNKPDYADARRISAELKEPFLAERYDEVYLAYNQYHSPLAQKPIVEKFLPFQPPAVDGGSTAQEHSVYLRAGREETAVPAPAEDAGFPGVPHPAGKFGRRTRRAHDGDGQRDEQRGRHDLELTLLRNRARQAAITKELSEIVSGAEAMK